MTVFAAKPDNLVPMISFIVLVVAVIGLLIASLINAVWLRLASLWLRVGEFRYDRAFGTALLSNLVFSAFGYPLALGILFGVSSTETYSRASAIYTYLSPASLFYLIAGTVLGHALIFSQRLPDKDGAPLTFGKAAALALVYLGISSAFGIIVWAVSSAFFVAPPNLRPLP